MYLKRVIYNISRRLSHTQLKLAATVSMAGTLFGVYWSRDGSWLYYQDVFGGVEQPIYRIHIPDRRVERVTTNGPFLRGDVRSYSFKALAPDDSPIIGLARATSDIYAVDFKLP